MKYKMTWADRVLCSIVVVFLYCFISVLIFLVSGLLALEDKRQHSEKEPVKNEQRR